MNQRTRIEGERHEGRGHRRCRADRQQGGAQPGGTRPRRPRGLAAVRPRHDHIPASGAIFWGSALANIHPGKDDTWVNYDNPDRALLLFISGSDDHLMPPSLQRSNAKHYKAPGLITEAKEYPGRHLLPVWPGWEQVAGDALDWALANARPASA